MRLKSATNVDYIVGMVKENDFKNMEDCFKGKINSNCH